MSKGFKDKSGKFRPTGSYSGQRVARTGRSSSSMQGVHRRRGQENLIDRKQTSAGISIVKPDEKPIPIANPPAPAFAYAGGKYRLRDEIVEKLPPHKTYVEPFAGAGNVLLAKSPSEKEVLNDKDPQIMKVHKAIKSRSDEWDYSPSRKRWESIRQKSPSERSGEDVAYMLEHSYGGKPDGTYTSHGKGGKLETEKLHEREKDVIMKSDDFAVVMRNWDSEQTLHYLDPPYSNDSINYSSKAPTPERVEDVASRMKGSVIVSYDNSRAVRDAFKGREWDIHKVEVGRGISGSNVKTKELLITNYDIRKERAKADSPDVKIKIPEN